MRSTRILRVLVTGRNRSGKSLFAERLVTAHKAKYFYFATLERTPRNLSRIRNHEGRRDGNCCVYEATGSVVDDIETLSSNVKEAQTVLLDGLSIYLLRLARNGTANANGWIGIAEIFLDLLA